MEIDLEKISDHVHDTLPEGLVYLLALFPPGAEGETEKQAYILFNCENTELPLLFATIAGNIEREDTQLFEFNKKIGNTMAGKDMFDFESMSETIKHFGDKQLVVNDPVQGDMVIPVTLNDLVRFTHESGACTSRHQTAAELQGTEENE